MSYRNSIVAISAVILCGGIGYYIGLNAKEESPTQLTPQSTPEVSRIATPYPTPPKVPKYIIREYQGKIGVFMGEKTTPEIIFDQYVHVLPDVDRRDLASGVTADSYEELLTLIEDYTS